MGLPEPAPFLSIPEYLQAEETAFEKHEYMDGVVRAMSGGTQEHSEVKVNLIRELSTRLRGRSCRPYDSDYRISVPAERCYFYPDASIICGGIETDGTDKHAAINPTAVFEVLSPSSEPYDRGNKMVTYRLCPSLREYVLLRSDMPLVEVFHRDDRDQWLHSAFNGLDATAFLPSLSLELPLRDLYEDVELPPLKHHGPYVVKEEEAAYTTR